MWRGIARGAIDVFRFPLGILFGLSLIRVTEKLRGLRNGKELSNTPRLSLAPSIPTDVSEPAESPCGYPGAAGLNNLSTLGGKPRVSKSRVVPVWWVHHDWESRPFGSWESAMEHVRMIHANESA